MFFAVRTYRKPEPPTIASLKFSLCFRRTSAQILIAVFLSTLSAFLCVTGVASPTVKPKPWIAKDWTQWTSDDCSSVLSNSPWIQTDYTPISGRSFKMTTVLLKSALPIRQAFLRKLQLQKRYDNMNAQQKQAFDQQNAADFADRAADNVIIIIENMGTGSLENMQGQPNIDSPDPPRQAALRIADDRFVLPTQTSKSSGETFGVHERMNHFEYTFPRMVDGQPPFAPTGTIEIGRGQKLVIDEKTHAVHASDFKSKGPVLLIALGSALVIDKKTASVEQRDFQSSGLPYLFKAADLMYKGKLEY
jgi:hypothetical protein